MENIQSDSFVKLTKNATKLLIQTSYLCNFHCLHCFQGEKTKSNISFTLLDLKKLITKINENSKLESVTFLGGEPFLYKELFDIVEYTNNLGLTSVVCTNGWNITSKLQEMQNVLHHLRVSIDGDNISHDEVRQRSGSYVHALNSLKVAKELGIKTSVTYTATKIGLSGLYTMAKDVLDLGARFMVRRRVRRRVRSPILQNPPRWFSLQPWFDPCALSTPVLCTTSLHAVTDANPSPKTTLIGLRFCRLQAMRLNGSTRMPGPTA